MGGAGARTLPPQIGKRIRKIIPAFSFDTVTTEVGSSFRGIKFFFTAWGGAPEKAKSLEIAVAKDGALEDSIYGRVGGLPLSISVEPSGSDTILKVTNPNGHPITVEVLKFLMGE